MQLSGNQSLALDFAPALPVGAQVLSVQQDGKAVTYQVEDHASDLHAVAQVNVSGSSTIEVRYRGGVAIDVVWQPVLEARNSIKSACAAHHLYKANPGDAGRGPARPSLRCPPVYSLEH